MGKDFDIRSGPIDPDQYYAGVDAVREELAGQTDRGAAIVGVALLDDRIRTVLEWRFDASMRAEDKRPI